jgi:hypothetical protein
MATTRTTPLTHVRRRGAPGDSFLPSFRGGDVFGGGAPVGGQVTGSIKAVDIPSGSSVREAIKNTNLRPTKPSELIPKIATAIGAKPAPSSQLFDPTQIARSLKQFESIRGRAVSPELVAGATKGAIEAQITPAILREEQRTARAEARKEAERDREFRRELAERGFQEESARAKAAGGAQIGTALGAAVGSFGGPVGTVVGGTLGGILGGSSIICTELYRQGYINNKTLLYTHIYRQKFLSNEEYCGYLLWATPVVELMKKSSKFSSIMAFFWLPIIKQVVSTVSARKGHWFGSMSLPIIRTFSKIVYKIRSQRWQILAEA